MTRIKLLLSIVLYWIGHLVFLMFIKNNQGKCRAYGLYSWLMVKSSDLDTEGRNWSFKP